jgi:phosphoribosylanthranilate isomerase
MRVKICGLTRLEDVNAALNEGADAVGFVVDSPASLRNLTFSKAKRLMKATRVFSTGVAVTSTRDPKHILKICTQLEPAALQLHYHTPKLLQLIRKREPSTNLILATPVRDNSSLKSAKTASHYSDAILADSLSLAGMGGTGLVNDWHLAAKIRSSISPHPLILAGGLTAKNVKAAIEKVKPFAVDVSSGVERSVGIKDHEKLREFIMNAKEMKV